MSTRDEDFGNWLVCDGRSLSRTKYRALYNEIGITYGANDSSTFKLPDFRGRVIGGVGAGFGLTSRDFGDTTGSETVTLTVPNLPSHTHTGTISSAGDHTHAHNAPGGGGAGGQGLVSATGGGTIVDTDWSGGELTLTTNPFALTISNAGTHTHTVTLNNTGGDQAFSVMQPTVFAVNVFIYAGGLLEL